jgi:Xaa-Pro aminopeptidase
MNTREKVAALRALMKKHGVAAYYIPSADPHLSEYLPECWKRRAWLSGFTGSAGELVIGRRGAGLWTDGRYFLQAELELAGSGIALMKLGQPDTPSMTEWVASHLRRGEALGIDPSVISVTAAEDFEEKLEAAGVRVKYIARNLVDRIWRDQPEPSLAPLRRYSNRLAGESVGRKLTRLRAAMHQEGCRAHVIGALDEIAWLLNVRGEDILHTPVVISYVVVTNRTATLYVDPRKVTKSVATALAPRVRVKPYTAVADDLKALARRPVRVWLDGNTTNRWIYGLLKQSDIYWGTSPITAFKSVKNRVQIEGITAAHVRDGVAMVKFLRWLEPAVRKGGVTEISAADKLYALRAEDSLLRDLSFATISGYAGNGAIIHYSATPQSDKRLRPRGLYLVDSGGQYLDGTTDITRTVTLGKPTNRQQECFTRVLMGMIDCTMTPFPSGTPGYRQEMFARRALWAIGEDYNHGTGHGVGQYLGVHEGPQSLKNVMAPPLVEGNLLSIEPGHYEAGKFGIRIENLAFVVRDQKYSSDERTWYRFAAVTLCPIDRRLIDKKLMTGGQVAWLNAYHKRVYRGLRPHLDSEHRKWLQRVTRPI